MAEIKDTSADGDVARTTGILRSWESIGSAVSYGVGATHWANLNQMILAFALWVFTIPFTLLSVFGSDWSSSARGSGTVGVDEESSRDHLDQDHDVNGSSLEEKQRVIVNPDRKG